QALGDLDRVTVGVAVKKDVGSGVHQDRTTHLVLPVVVMGYTAQRSLDAAEDHRYMGVGLLAALAVDQTGAIRALAGQTPGSVGRSEERRVGKRGGRQGTPLPSTKRVMLDGIRM